MDYDIQWPNSLRGYTKNVDNPYLYIISTPDRSMLGTGRDKDLFLANPSDQVVYSTLKGILELASTGKSEARKSLDDLIAIAEMTDEERERKAEYDFFAAPSRVYGEY